MGKRGRPKGRTDRRERQGGRWSDETRARLNIPPKPPSRPGAVAPSVDIRQVWGQAAAPASGSNSSAADAETAASDAQTAAAEAALAAQVAARAVAAALAAAADSAADTSRHGTRDDNGAEVARAARGGVDETEIDGEAMARISVSKEVKAKLSGDQRYLCAAMGTSLPLLPVHGKEENALFSRLALAQLRGSSSTIDFDKLALTWCEYVNGTTVFPKLPVYLRQHYAAWQKSQRIKDTLKRIQPQLDALNATLAAPSPALAAAPAPAEPTTGAATTAVFAATTAAAAAVTAAAFVVAQHVALPHAPPAMAVAQADIPLCVAGIRIGGATEPAPQHVPGRKRSGDRKPEGEKRKRTCKQCREGTGLGMRQVCPGARRKSDCVNV